ncbi:PH domain-containing protein [Thermasporomyces composti]|uniref:PH (Pleckstrin Homology) domain-containing protein n=1 Tax=Thermasporomyces composti TaxID=696763 RepID=A0A3D9VB60_THECX|nr:PH domain-containing protein [Thermasporomyces composti]REF35374.1 PH (Pleckstrin Homology) domain-containing protein [Thermasporomyces composti]
MSGPIRWLRRAIADPKIVRHLLADEGEVVVDEVRHHWVVYVVPMLECVVALALLVVMLKVPVDAAWIPFAAALVILVHAGWRALNEHMDRFVITNMRVFRVSGVLTKKIATTPIARILDITVDKPFIGRILGYGHFVFESAAQEQGLRDIRYVGNPDQRDLTIQRLLQRSGLRATAKQDDEEEEQQPAPTPVPVVRGRPRANHPRRPGPPTARRLPR